MLSQPATSASAAGAAPGGAARANAYDLHELAGAFGDLGTLIPFVVGYVAVVKLDPAGVLLTLGPSQIGVGLLAVVILHQLLRRRWVRI